MRSAEASSETGLYGWVQAAACIVAVGLALAFYTPESGLVALTEPGPTVQARFEIVLVDDTTDALAPRENSELPAGITLLSEVTPDGAGGHVRHHYARLVPQGGETLEQAVLRLEPWVANLGLPADQRLAWQRETLDDSSAPSDAFRSFVLRNTPIVTSRDITHVELSQGANDLWSTKLSMGPVGAGLLRRTTREHLHERMAIVVNGRVLSAPIIQGEIKDGFLQISPGGSDPERTRHSAKALYNELTTSTPP